MTELLQCQLAIKDQMTRNYQKYRGSPHSAFFGGTKKSRYAKSRYASPILVLKCKHGGKTFSKSTF